MKIYLIAVGTKMPAWVNAGVMEYFSRLPRGFLSLIEINAIKRSKNMSVAHVLQKEGERMCEAIPQGSLCIALDVKGESWDTLQWANKIQSWQREARDVSLLIGGPEGLSPVCYERAQLRWSLSKLTFPHPLVRIIILEQIYRAHTLLIGHPYHKGYTHRT